jgi:hypothetical protein
MLNSYVFHPLPPSPSSPPPPFVPSRLSASAQCSNPISYHIPDCLPFIFVCLRPIPPPPSDSPLSRSSRLPPLPLPGAGCAGHQMCLSHHDMCVLSPSTLPPYSLEILAWEKLTFSRCLRGGGSATFSDSNAGPRPPHVRASRLLHLRRHIRAAFVPTHHK